MKKIALLSLYFARSLPVNPHTVTPENAAEYEQAIEALLLPGEEPMAPMTDDSTWVAFNLCMPVVAEEADLVDFQQRLARFLRQFGRPMGDMTGFPVILLERFPLLHNAVQPDLMAWVLHTYSRVWAGDLTIRMDFPEAALLS